MRFDMRRRHFTILHRSFATHSLSLVGWQLFERWFENVQIQFKRPSNRPHLIYFNDERNRQDCRRGFSCHVLFSISFMRTMSSFNLSHFVQLRKMQHVDLVIIEQVDFAKRKGEKGSGKIQDPTTTMKRAVKTTNLKWVKKMERDRDENEALWLNWIVYRHSFYYLCLVSLQLHFVYVNPIVIGNIMCTHKRTASFHERFYPASIRSHQIKIFWCFSSINACILWYWIPLTFQPHTFLSLARQSLVLSHVLLTHTPPKLARFSRAQTDLNSNQHIFASLTFLELLNTRCAASIWRSFKMSKALQFLVSTNNFPKVKCLQFAVMKSTLTKHNRFIERFWHFQHYWCPSRFLNFAISVYALYQLLSAHSLSKY